MIQRALDLIRKHLPAIEPGQIKESTTPTAHPSTAANPPSVWLRVLPPLLTGVFLLSFHVDHEGLLRILSVSGLIGYGTNWLAIAMLFRPRRKRPILGWGLIPANKERIAVSLAQSVSRNLINPDLIRTRMLESKVLSSYLTNLADRTTGILASPAFRNELDTLLLDEIRSVVDSDTIRKQAVEALADAMEDATKASRLEHIAFKTYRKVRGDRLEAIIDRAMRSIPDHVEPHLVHVHRWLDAFPQEAGRHVQDLEIVIIDSVHRVLSEMNLSALIRDTVRAYDEKRLETLIQDASSDQLRHIQYLGAVLGTLGGFLIWKPHWAIPVFAGGLAVVWGLDALIDRWTVARARQADANPRKHPPL